MKFEVKSDFNLVSGSDPFSNSIKLMQRIGNMLVRNIVARTQFENIDPEGKKFRPYSLDYAKYKIKEGGSGNIVNLKSVIPVGEQMVVSTGIISMGIKGDMVEVGVFGLNLKKAMWNENLGRSFLGISDDDEKDIDKIIDDYMDEELRKI